MDNTKQIIFSLIFPDKRVYIENTSKCLIDKVEDIRKDKDHDLYQLLQEYPNPKIVNESMKIKSQDIKKLVASKYKEENYKILNPKVFPSPSLFQSLYKWMGY